MTRERSFERRSVRAREVLILAHDLESRATCRRLLRSRGLRARFVDDAEDVLAHLARRPYQALVVDLELSDLDALGLMRAIRAHAPTQRLPVVARASSSDQAIRDLLTGTGCDLVHVGPFDATVFASLADHGEHVRPGAPTHPRSARCMTAPQARARPHVGRVKPSARRKTAA